MQITGPVTADLNYIKPDANITPEVFYSGGEAPQKYNEAYAFMSANIDDGRPSHQDFQIHKQGFQLVNSPSKIDDFENEALVEGTYYLSLIHI